MEKRPRQRFYCAFGASGLPTPSSKALSTGLLVEKFLDCEKEHDDGGQHLLASFHLGVSILLDAHGTSRCILRPHLEVFRSLKHVIDLATFLRFRIMQLSDLGQLGHVHMVRAQHLHVHSE